MIRSCVMLLVGAALLTRADERADQLIVEGIAEFTAAYAAWDDIRFGAAAGLFREACRLTPETSAHYYWLGVAEFHRMLRLQSPPGGPPDMASAAFAREAALEALTRAVSLDARQAECHALLGTIYGLKIGGNLFRALQYGPRVQKHRARALKCGPENPRVRYLLGVGQFHTAQKPASFREALESLRAAERLFEVEAGRAAGPQEPRWGRGSCLTFLGRTHEALGEYTEAERCFRRALSLQPSDHLAAEGLARVTAAP